jgi:hypothetical protein
VSDPLTKDAAGIDPRGPRFAAGITALLLLVAVLLGLTGLSTAGVSEATLAQRALDPAFLLVLAIALLFLWGVLSPRTAPWGVIYRRPPRFAQGVGLFVTALGLILHLLGVAWALPVAAAAAFIAAFLNSAFAYCLGCQMYLLLQRAGVIGRERPAA